MKMSDDTYMLLLQSELYHCRLLSGPAHLPRNRWREDALQINND